MKQRCVGSILSLLLCVVVLCGVSVHAAETRASERIYQSTVLFSKTSSGDFSIYFSVRATGKMDIIGASSVEVQRNTLTGWVTEFTFTPDNTPTIQAEDKFQHSATLTYSPLFKGKEYRAVATIYVEDTSGASTKQLTSKTMTA